LVFLVVIALIAVGATLARSVEAPAGN